MRRLRSEAVEWLRRHPEVLALYDGRIEGRDAVARAMKQAGVLRAATADHFLRIDLYVQEAKEKI